MAETATSPATVPVISPEGDLGTIPAAQLGEALKAGYSQATTKQVEAEQFKEEHDSPLKAAGLGVLSGATLGLGNELLNKTGLTTPESQAAYKEENPLAFGASEFAGSLLPIAGAEALTGGAATPELVGGALSGVAERAAAGTVADAAQAGVEAAARAAAPAPGAGTLGHLAKDFAIGTGLAGGQQITEDALGDNHALDAEVLVPAMLTGGALASVAGLGLRGAANVVTPALERASSALGSASDTLSDFLAQRAIKAGVKEGLDEDALRMATSDPLAASDPKVLAAEKAQQLARKQDLGKDLLAKVRDVSDAMKSADKDFHANIRPDEANNLLANHDLEAVRESAQGMLEQSRGVVDQLAADPEVNTKTLAKARALLDAADAATERAEKPGDVFNALNDYKREQAKLSKFNKLAFGTDQESTLNGMRQLTAAVQDHLEDTGIYGDAAARQAEINAAETKLIRSRDQLMGDFGRTEIGTSGRKIRVLDEDKFKTFLGQVAVGKRTAQLGHLSQFLDAAKGLTDTYSDSLKNVPGKGMQLGPADIRNLLDVASDARNQGLTTAQAIAKKAPVGPATAYQSIGGRVGQPAQYDKGILGVGEAGLLMAGAHMVGVPAPLIGGAALARAVLGGEALPPATTVKVLAMIAKARKAFSSAADGAVSNLLKRGAGKAESVLPIVTEHMSRGPQDFQFGSRSHAGLSDRESFALHAQDIQAATARPSALDGNNKLLEGAPTVGAQALAAHQRVLGMMTPPEGLLNEHEQQALMFDQPDAASPMERQDWVNRANILHEPLSVIPLISSGMLTQESVDTLKAGYPALHADLSRRLIQGIGEMTPKERAKLSAELVDQLSTFVGVPLSRLQAPSTLVLSQMAGVGQPGGGSPMAPTRIRKTAPLKFGQRAQTPNQAADAVLAGH